MNAVLLLLLAAAPTPMKWNFPTGPAPEVEVSNINGSIRVEAGAGGEVTVEARQEGSEEERARWSVEARQAGDHVEVQVCCGPCEQKQHDCRSGSLKTHLTLRVPRGAELELSAVNADVQVKGVAGEQEVSTVNGLVELSGSQKDVTVSTVNGNVVLAPQALGRTEVSTVAGDVKMQLPERADAQLDFSSVGGTFNGRSVHLGSVHQTYGEGTHDVEVSTVSGRLDVAAR